MFSESQHHWSKHGHAMMKNDHKFCSMNQPLHSGSVAVSAPFFSVAVAWGLTLTLWPRWMGKWKVPTFKGYNRRFRQSRFHFRIFKVFEEQLEENSCFYLRISEIFVGFLYTFPSSTGKWWLQVVSTTQNNYIRPVVSWHHLKKMLNKIQSEEIESTFKYGSSHWGHVFSGGLWEFIRNCIQNGKHPKRVPLPSILPGRFRCPSVLPRPQLRLFSNFKASSPLHPWTIQASLWAWLTTAWDHTGWVVNLGTSC